MYKKNVLVDVWFDESIEIEDSLFSMECARKNPQLQALYIELKLYIYFIRPDSLSKDLSCNSVLKLAEKYYNCALDESDNAMKNILLIESLRRCLSSRYEYHYIVHDKKMTLYCHSLAMKILSRLKESRIKYMIMVIFPRMYRLFRIITDPTILDWEKNN